MHDFQIIVYHIVSFFFTNRVNLYLITFLCQLSHLLLSHYVKLAYIVLDVTTSNLVSRNRGNQSIVSYGGRLMILLFFNMF